MNKGSQSIQWVLVTHCHGNLEARTQVKRFVLYTHHRLAIIKNEFAYIHSSNLRIPDSVYKLKTKSTTELLQPQGLAVRL